VYDSILEESGKKGKGENNTSSKAINEGKKLMKSNQF